MGLDYLLRCCHKFGFHCWIDLTALECFYLCSLIVYLSDSRERTSRFQPKRFKPEVFQVSSFQPLRLKPSLR